MSTCLFSWVGECSSPIPHTLGNYMKESPVRTPKRWLQILKPKFHRSHKAFWVSLLSMSIVFRDGKNSLSHLIRLILCYPMLVFPDLKRSWDGDGFCSPYPESILTFYLFIYYILKLFTYIWTLFSYTYSIIKNICFLYLIALLW